MAPGDALFVAASALQERALMPKEIAHRHTTNMLIAPGHSANTWRCLILIHGDHKLIANEAYHAVDNRRDIGSVERVWRFRRASESWLIPEISHNVK